MSPEIKCVFAAYDWAENVSGPATWLLRLLPRLQQAGISCHVDALLWDAEGPLVKGLRSQNISVESTMLSGTTEDRIRGILKRVSAKSPDIFIANNVTPALYAGRFFRESGVATIAVLHSDDEFYTGILDRFAGGRPSDTVSCMVAVSQLLAEFAGARVGSVTKIARIPYGVPLPVVPENRRPAEYSINVVYAGRLAVRQKRILDVAQAMIRLTAEVPGCEGIIIGDGPDRNTVETLLLERDTAQRVRLTGRLEASQVQAAMAEGDVILLLSDYEGLPIALLEGMAMGLVPIVSEMRSGIPELIEHRRNGLIVTDRSDAVVDAVKLLRFDPLLRETLAKAARQTVINHYSEESSAASWCSLLWELSPKHSRRRGELLIPSRIDLPPVHSAMQWEDPRASMSGGGPLHAMLTRAASLLRRAYKRR